LTSTLRKPNASSATALEDVYTVRATMAFIEKQWQTDESSCDRKQHTMANFFLTSAIYHDTLA
jgi:hypothetical protein